VTLKGFRGGHSGLEIHEGRANANKEMVRFVRKAIAELGVRLASWHGGNMRNAIPFKAEVVLALAKDQVAALKQMADEHLALIADEFKTIEKNAEMFVEEVEAPATVLPLEIQDNLIDAIYACHNGVLRMIPVYPDVVETSSNLAIIDIEGGKAAFKCWHARAGGYERIYLHATRKLLQHGWHEGGVWPAATVAGTPTPTARCCDCCKRFTKITGQRRRGAGRPCGLECSIILGKYPHLDVLSFAPHPQPPHGYRALRDCHGRDVLEAAGAGLEEIP
jgi:dipeptidase D